MESMHDQYFALLRQAVFSPDPEEALAALADLGRDFLRQEIPPEEITEMHHEALLRLARENPQLSLLQVAQRISAPLMEVSMAYSLAFHQQVAQKYAALVNERLAQTSKLEAIGTLAAGVAHDFNTILGIISGYAEMLGDDFPPETRGGHNARNIVTAAMRARDLIARLLVFARQRPVEPVQVDAVALLRETFVMMQDALPPGIRKTFTSDVASAGMIADPSQIQQIMMNLCTNAADAMNGKGELAVSISSSAPGAEQQQARRLLLTVADTGCGMPPELLQRVFDPFFTTKEPGKGSGLGLSVVYGIVGDLKGEIQVQSRVGVGTCFKIYLPLPEPEHPAASV